MEKGEKIEKDQTVKDENGETEYGSQLTRALSGADEIDEKPKRERLSQEDEDDYGSIMGSALGGREF